MPLLLSWPVYGKDTDLGKRRNLFRIDQIQISGIKKVEREAILEKIESRPGLMLDNYLLRKDIKKIYSLKYFSHVEAHKKIIKGKKTLFFKVVEKPLISKITFNGNDELSTDDLTSNIKTKAFSILDINAIKEDVASLRKQYEEKGFYLAKISYRLKEKKGSVELIFDIKEFERIRVKKIIFLGNKSFSDMQLKSIMETREDSLFAFMSGAGSFRQIKFQTDVERIKYFYRTKGYLQVNVGVPEITFSEDKRWVFISMKVNEGPQFKINEITFQGEDLFTDQDLLKEINLRNGMVYSEELLRKDIQLLTEKYQDKGYAFANVLRTLDIIPGENKVNVEFSFEKGNIVYFGKIMIKGNSKTRDKVIRRELKISEGAKFSGSALRESKENVTRLGFFEPASVIFNTVSPPGQDDVIDVEIQVKEMSTGKFSLGAGYSTQRKFFIQSSIAQNNFLGRGQVLEFSLNHSSQNKSYRFSFTEPYLNDSKWTVGGDIFNTLNQGSNAFQYRKNGIVGRVGHPIFEYTRIFVTYKYENTKLRGVSDPTIDEALENGVASSMRFRIEHDKRDHRSDPTKGHYTYFNTEYAGLGGDKNWVKGEVDTSYFFKPYGDVVFRSHFSISKLMRVNSKPIPRSEKLFLGGSRTLRGYGFEAIGPMRTVNVDGQDRTFNERGLFATYTNLELEHPLAREAGLKMALFFDIGAAGYRKDLKFYKNYGFGFRWFSPIGILRFDFGYPLDDVDKGGGSQVHFDIGQLF